MIFENLKFLVIWRLYQHFVFVFAKKIPNFQIFKKPEYRYWYVRIVSEECMWQVSSSSVQKRCFYSILNVKNGNFSGHLT